MTGSFKAAITFALVALAVVFVMWATGVESCTNAMIVHC
jgi:hypothetical protein